MTGKEITIRKAEGLKISHIIEQKGLTPYRINLDVEIMPNQLKSIINGDSNYTIDTLNKLKIYLGIISDSDIEEAEMYLENYKS
jgi:plasmid maintenance system antidote protein VapI